MAIAFDAASGGSNGGSGNTVTFSHTCSGSDRILFVGVGDYNGDFVTGVTYAGVSMTLIAKQGYNSNTNYEYLYYLVAPATGANNVVISRSTSSGWCVGDSASYTGVKQTSPIDAYTTKEFTSADGTSLTTTLSSVADNCWFVLGMNSQRNLTASTGVTARHQQITQSFIGDSNSPKTPAGSYSMTVTISQANASASVMASFAPVATATTNSAFLLNFM
jgi:hypothetical protein